MNKRWLIFLFSIASILRLGFIWIAPAWYDENFTLIVSRLPFTSMLAAVAGDVHPPLWYLLLWPLGQLQAPIWVLRIPAALLSVFSVGIFWSILGELELSPRVRTAALVLMIVMPIQLYYAMEARMYALLEFLVLAACLAILKKKWIWFGLACAAMLYTQYYGVFYLAALCLTGLIWHNFKSWRSIILAAALAGLAFLPWLIVLQSQMSTLHNNYWMQLTGVGMVLRVLFENLFMPPQNAVTQIPLMLAGFAWLVVALIFAFRNRSKSIGVVSMLAFLPFVFAIIFSLIWQPVLHYRPLIGISPFIYILLAGPVNSLFIIHLDRDELYTDIRKMVLVAIFILPLILVCDGSIYANLRTNKLPTSAAELTYIQAHWQPGDIVYHFSDDSWVNIVGTGGSETRPDMPNFKAPDCGATLGSLSPATRTAIGQKIFWLSDLAYKRAWIIWSDSPVDPICVNAQLIGMQTDPKSTLIQYTDPTDEYVMEELWLTSK